MAAGLAGLDQLDEDSKALDRWADWLTRGRDRGLSAAAQRRGQAHLRRFRQRVLSGARLRPGERVLDVGAGTGLLALEARRLVGSAGRVLALDISADTLSVCVRDLDPDQRLAPLHPIVGDAADLPVADGAVDAVLTRSVLAYVPDKGTAAREFYRVLRPGGRASLFEPINSVDALYPGLPGPDLGALRDEAGRVRAHLHAAWQRTAGESGMAAMLGFDERDLVRAFIAAGFAAVSLSYELRYERSRAVAREQRGHMHARMNPNALSYAEAAEAVLGAEATRHLAELARVMGTQASARLRAGVYLTARR